MKVSVIAIAAILTGTSPALADSATESAKSDRDSIVVVGRYAADVASTATKTDTPLIETPISVQVVPDQVLLDQRPRTLGEALANVSGISAWRVNDLVERITLRGFTTTTVFRDGFRLDDPNLSDGMTDLANIDRIEVMKGPAGMIYGRVEPGGVVNVITRKPLPTASYVIEQSAGAWGFMNTSLEATGPLTSSGTLLYRLDGDYERADSWRDNVQHDRIFVAPSLRWKAGADTDIVVQGTYLRNTLTGDPGGILPVDPVSGNPVFLPAEQTLTYVTNRQETSEILLDLNHRFTPDWSVRLRAIHHKTSFRTPGNGYPVVAPLGEGFVQTATGWSVDLGLDSFGGKTVTNAVSLDLNGKFATFGIEHSLLLGGDYYRVLADYLQVSSNLFGPFFTQDALRPQPVTGLTLDPETYVSYQTRTRHYGIYLQDQIRLTETLRLLAGVRWQHVDQHGTSTIGTGYFGTGLPESDPKQRDQKVTSRFGVLWRPAEQISFYGHFAENFGANNGRDWQGNPLQPESAREYEAGMKVELFNRRLNGSLAWFDLTKTNVAVLDIDHQAIAPGSQATIGAVNSRGLELDVSGAVTDRLNVIVALTYDNARVTKSTPGSSYAQGNRLANVPRYMARLAMNWSLPDRFAPGLRIGGGVTWNDTALDSTNLYVTPAFAVWDAMIGYDFTLGGREASLQINGKNLLDRRYYTQLQVYSSAYVNYGTPRSVQATFRVKL